MTQRESVEFLLRCAGARGVTTGFFLEYRIPRFSARINELRDDGWLIETRRLSDSSHRYTLISEPLERPAGQPLAAPEEARSSAGDEADPLKLFDAPHKPLGAYDRAA